MPDTTEQTLRLRIRRLEQALERAKRGDSGGTGLPQALKDAEAAREEAERTAQANRRFLANMSHEMRTPLAAIIGYADLARDPDVDLEERGEALEHLRRNAEHLLALVGDVLDLSRVEAGALDLHRRRIDPIEQLERVRATLLPKAAEKGCAVTLSSRSALPTRLQTDPVRFRQILVNLGHNAVKFAPVGSEVALVADFQATLAGGQLTLEVVDTGPGIPVGERDRIFEAFGQTEVGRSAGGAGLGLSISAELAKALGGRLEVDSEPGRTVFRFVHPVEEGSGGHLTSSHAVGLHDLEGELSGSHVLVVDDAEDNLRILEYQLTKAGARVSCLARGEDVLAFLCATPDVDCVLLDQQMQGMSGPETVKELRQIGFRIPVVLLTADVTPEAMERAERSGANDFLTKPVPQSRLVITVSGVLSDVSAQGEAEDPSLLPVYRELSSGRRERIRELALGSEELNAVVHQVAGTGTSFGFPAITRFARAYLVLEARGAALSDLRAARDALLLRMDQL